MLGECEKSQRGLPDFCVDDHTFTGKENTRGGAILNIYSKCSIYSRGIEIELT